MNDYIQLFRRRLCQQIRREHIVTDGGQEAAGRI